ncbi:hypothetical protein Bca52824_042151 [Brassica carinata]|uniref:Uncharacterized protein n=1 Tax=Brassica carinata TaxID=52824 RepID=A0A8X7RWS4_BRACI|nr:hypothetical protein Bca52824_042151 [Brassica carinata]
MTHGAVGSSSTASSAANYTGEPRTFCYVFPQEKTSHTSIQGSSMELCGKLPQSVLITFVS